MIRPLLLLLLFFSTIAKIDAQDSKELKQSTVSKQVSTYTIEALQLQMEKKIWVYLPDNYLTSKKEILCNLDA